MTTNIRTLIYALADLKLILKRLSSKIEILQILFEDFLSKTPLLSDSFKLAEYAHPPYGVELDGTFTFDAKAFSVLPFINYSSMDASNAFKGTTYTSIIIPRSTFSLFSTTNASYMFADASQLTSVDLTGIALNDTHNFSYMFENCPNLVALNSPKEIISLSNVVNQASDCSHMFNNCSSIKSVQITDSFKISGNDVRLDSMFKDCKALTIFGCGGQIYSPVDMSNMFSGCENLSSFQFTNFRIPNCISMQSMFENCKSIVDINIMPYDYNSYYNGNLTNIENAFFGCSNLINLNGFNFNLDLDTQPGIQSFSNICNGCTSLRVIKIEGTLRGLTNMYQAFLNCSNLDTLDLREMITNSSKDKELDCRSMLNGCTKLRNLYLSPSIYGEIDATGAVNLEEIGCNEAEISNINTSKKFERHHFDVIYSITIYRPAPPETDTENPETM